MTTSSTVLAKNTSNPLDYSKWDNLVRELSDDEEDDDFFSDEMLSSDEEDEDEHHHHHHHLHRHQHPMAAITTDNKGNIVKSPDEILTATRIKMAYHGIFVHPKDDPNRLRSIFYRNPHQFSSSKNRFGRIQGWGVADAMFSDSSDHYQNERMRTRFLYGCFSKESKMFKFMPEVQFVHILMNRKRKVIKSRKGPVYKKHDLIIKIAFLDHNRNILNWRRFKVSSAIKLQTLQEKVLGPMLGWSSNDTQGRQHAYLFTDPTDGALFGPPGLNSEDVMEEIMQHIESLGYAFLNASEVALGQLVWKPGAELDFTYHLGHQFNYTLHVEKVLEIENSDQKLKVLAGEGAYPPDDSIGLWPRFGKGSKGAGILWGTWNHLSREEQEHVMSECSQAPNYSNFQNHFHPFQFDLSKCENRVRTAVKAPTVTKPTTLPSNKRSNHAYPHNYTSNNNNSNHARMNYHPSNSKSKSSHHSNHKEKVNFQFPTDLAEKILFPPHKSTSMMSHHRCKGKKVCSSKKKTISGGSVKRSPFPTDESSIALMEKIMQHEVHKLAAKERHIHKRNNTCNTNNSQQNSTIACETRSDDQHEDGEEEKELCANCGSSENLKRCSKCKQVFYCSSRCQVQDWKGKHRKECKNVPAAAN